MSRYINADEMLEYLDLMYEHQDDKDEPYNIGILGAINYIKHKAPSIELELCEKCGRYRTKGRTCNEADRCRCADKGGRTSTHRGINRK